MPASSALIERSSSLKTILGLEAESLFGLTDYAAFILLLAIPGPGNLALILSTGKGGVRGGLAATLGIIPGDQVLLWLAVAGVAALLKAHPTAFQLLQWLGALYLAWLGLRMLLAKPGAAPAVRIEARHYLRQSLLITLLNPKAILFYMAFFPLFIDPQQHRGMLTFGVMALTVVVLTFICGCLAMLATQCLADRLRASPRIALWLEKLAGCCLLGFGIKLTLR